MKKIFAIFSALLAVFLIVDVSLSSFADRTIKSHNYYFQEKMDSDHLNFNGSRLQNCVFTEVYYVYVYRTCFILNSSFDDQDKWLFNFVYQGPKPILFGGRNTQSYYFEMLSAAPTVYKIYQDGIIEKIAF